MCDTDVGGALCKTLELHLSLNVSLWFKVKGFQCPNDSSAFVGVLVSTWFLQENISSLKNVLMFLKWTPNTKFLASGSFVIIISALVLSSLMARKTWKKFN